MGYVSSFSGLQSTAEQGRAPCEFPSRPHALDPTGKSGSLVSGSRGLPVPGGGLLCSLEPAEVGRGCYRCWAVQEARAEDHTLLKQSPARTRQGPQRGLHGGLGFILLALLSSACLSAQPGGWLGWNRAGSCSLSQRRTPWTPSLVERSSPSLKRATDSMAVSGLIHQGA